MTKNNDDSEKKRELCIKWLLKAKLRNVKKDKHGDKQGKIFMPERVYDIWNSLDNGTQTSILLEVNEKRKDVKIYPKDIFIDMKEVKKKVQKDDKIQICSLVEGDRIIEEIYIPESKKAGFIVYDPDGIRTETEIGPYIPKEDDILKKGTIILPEGVMDYGTPEELKEEIKNYIHEYVDIPPEFEELSSYYILLTWVYDKLKTIPYLRPIGDTSTGKSRFLKVVGGLCYHKTSISGAVTPAPIYRMIEQWKPTLIIDEGDVRSSNEKNEFITILNCGFEKNNPVVRCNKDDPDKLESHEVFCPKLIATRYRFEDSALESRCITIEMRPTGREDIPILLPKKFYEKRKELQKKLLKFRLDTYFLIDSDVSERLQKELHRDIDKRLLQATGPLLCLTNVPGLDKVYKDFIESYNVKLIEERGDSTTGIIVNALFDLIKIEIENKDLQDLKITPADVSTYITEKLKEDISDRKVGRELKAVGIESKREWDKIDKKTKRILILKPELLEELQLKYRLPEDRIDMTTAVTVKTAITDKGAMGIPEFSKKDKHKLKHETSLRSTNSNDRNVRNGRSISKKSQHEKLQELQKLVYDLGSDGKTAELTDIIKEAKNLGMDENFVLHGIEELLKTGEIWSVGNNRFGALKVDHTKEKSTAEGSS